MLGLGIASSHAPAMFCPLEFWPKVYAAIPDYMKDSQPHAAKLETPEVINAQIERIGKALGVLRGELERYAPDALVVIGDDQGDMFNDSNMPSFCIYTGEEIWGSTAPGYMDEAPELSRVTIPVHAEIADYICSGLIKRQFDPSKSSCMQPLGNPERGGSHMIFNPVPRLVPDLDIPIVPIFVNEYYAPLPTARRCWDLGLALGEILAERPERIAIYASGGLSHDPAGPRAGWVDEPLDRWVLERIERNEGEQLTSLFTFDSDTLRGGSGEIRAWITVAGACQRAAKIVDYFPSHHAKAGLGFAYWPVVP